MASEFLHFTSTHRDLDSINSLLIETNELIVNTRQQPPQPIFISSHTNILVTDSDRIVVTAAPVTIFLPDPATQPGMRKNITIIESNSGISTLNPITITGTGGALVDGAASLQITAPQATVTLTFINGNWVSIAVGLAQILSITLPAPLTSIASLTTVGNEIIYTVATNTYATSPITALARTLLTNTTQNGMQSTLGTIVGTHVQAQNALLQGLSGRNPVSGSGKIFYATGVNVFDEQDSQAFGRSLLNEASAASARATLSAVQRATAPTTDTALARWSGTDGALLQNSGILIDASDNITLPGSANLLMGTGTLAGLTQAELAQLQNIDATTITTTQWGWIGSQDQATSSTSTPTFAGLSANNQRITAVAAPSAGTDAANKTYVDTTAASGAPPLPSAAFATSAVLPNTPDYVGAPTNTLTSTAGAGVALQVDNFTLTVAQEGLRVLVKNQADPVQNGLYVVTVYGGGGAPWVLTRVAEFDHTSAPIPAGSSVFVSLGGYPGTTNEGTSWALSATVTVIGDPVLWVQTGGVLSYTAGTGIDAAQLGAAVVQIEKTARFTVSGNALELATVPVTHGGTGQTTLTAGNVLVGNGAAAVSATLAAPTTDFVGLDDVQALTNKSLVSTTNTVRASEIGTTGASVNVALAAAPPGAGYTLQTTSATTATWQMPTGVDPANTIRVYQGAPNTYPNYATLTAALSVYSVDWNTTSTNYMTILIYPGVYAETNPIALPPYVVIRGMSSTAAVVLQSTNATANFFQVNALGGNQWFDIEVRGAAGTGNTAGAAFVCSGVSSPTPKATNCVVRNYYQGWECIGTGAAQSAVMLCHFCVALVTIPTFLMNRAFAATAGAILETHITNASGFFVGGFAGTIDTGYFTSGTGSIGVHFEANVSHCNTAYLVLSGGDQRLWGGQAGLVRNFGFDVGASGTLRVSNVFINDDSLTDPVYANQIHFRGDPALTLVETSGIIINAALSSVPPNTNVIGSALDINPDEPATRILGEFAVGFPGNGYESIFGKGDSHTLGMTVFFYDQSATSYSDVTSALKRPDNVGVTLFPDLTAAGQNDALYIGGSIESFPGLRIRTTTAAAPLGGNLNLTDPPAYPWAWEYWDGTAWTAFRIMTTQTSGDYTAYGQDCFRLGSEHVRFHRINDPDNPLEGPGITYLSAQSSAPWILPSGLTHAAWTQTTVNGVFGYWVRLRRTTTSGLTVSPIVDQIRLHTDRTEINPDGYMEFYGSARPKQAIQGITLNSFFPGNSAPSNQTLYISSSFPGVAFTDNSFPSNSDRSICVAFRLPAGVCTSCDLTLRWSWSVPNANAGNVTWQVRWAYTKPHDEDSGGVSKIYSSSGAAPVLHPTEQYVTFHQATAASNAAGHTVGVGLAMPDVVTKYTNRHNDGDVVWLAISRLGLDPTDTYGSNVYVYETSLEAIWHTVGN